MFGKLSAVIITNWQSQSLGSSPERIFGVEHSSAGFQRKLLFLLVPWISGGCGSANKQAECKVADGVADRAQVWRAGWWGGAHPSKAAVQSTHRESLTR